MTTVKDVMHTSVLQVSQDTLVKEVARNIFSSGISTIPIVHGKKLVGIVTEEDILEHMYPGLHEISHDKKRAHDINGMEQNFLNLLDSPVRKVMNPNVVTVYAQTSLAEAQEIMLRHNFTRLPVISKDGALLGMVAAKDVFKQVIKNDLPQLERDRYAMFMADHYDNMINWKQRFEEELPSLLRVFEREGVQKIVDLGSWTGVFSIELAQHGMHVYGLETNELMVRVAQDKKNKLPQAIQKNIEFNVSNYQDISRDVKAVVDCVMCLGNALLYLPADLNVLFKGAHKVLRRDGIIILQVLNVDRVLQKKDRLLNFQIQKKENRKEHLFLEFLDKYSAKTLKHNLVVFEHEDGEWEFHGETTLDIKYVKAEDIVKSLQEEGFYDISVSGYQSEYQGEYSPIPFIKPYDPKTSDWMVIFGKKK